MSSDAARAVSRRAYFPHVDGLRCVAVLAVLLFHFGVPGLDGGYVGVDVFFVISGYLITRIIADEVTATGRFGFRDFYARRIRRIVPALLATLAATTLVAVASLPPAELVAYGRSLLASAVSLSNLLFWSESGYFDADSSTKPLLHTWSLSVEEQFYLVWPAFLYLCGRRFGARGLLWGIVFAGAASFLANHAVVAAGRVGYGSDLFFLPQFRVFEFAIGALGCFLGRHLPAARWAREALALAGLGMIAWAVLRLEEGVVFPYTNALAPCVGTLLAILAGGSSRCGALLLGSGPVVWVGRISYSLYLVHWPVVVFVEQYLPAAPWGARFALMALLSLAGAVALHYGVEARFRNPGTGRAKARAVAATLAGSAVLGLAGLAVAASNGMPWRYHHFTPGALAVAVATPAVAATGSGAGGRAGFHPLDAAAIEAGKARRFEDLAAACRIADLADATRCHMDRPSQVLLFGNSHEPDAFNAFNRIYGRDPRVNLINFGTVNDCRIELAADGFSSPTQELDCARRFAVLGSGEFLRRLDVVVYNTHQGFDPVARDLWAVLERIQRANPGIRIVAIGSYLQTTAECASLYNRHGSYDACRQPGFVNYHNPRERVDTTVPQVATLDYLYISKYRLLCGGERLEGCAVSANGEPAFYDQHHLSKGFAQFLGDRIARVHGADLGRIGLPVPDGTQ